MKRIISLIAIGFFIANIGFAQKYKVVQMIGNVDISGISIKTGYSSSILPNDIITFSPSYSGILVQNEKGEFALLYAPYDLQKERPDRVKGEVKDYFKPLKIHQVLGISNYKTTQDLKNLFGNGKFAVLDNKMEIELSKISLPMNTKSYFYIKYDYEGNEITKKLSYEGNKLALSKADLALNNGKKQDISKIKSITLGRYISNKKESVDICSFKPVFIPKNELVPMVEMLAKELKKQGKSKDDILLHTAGLLSINYGKTDKVILKAWMEKHNLL